MALLPSSEPLRESVGLAGTPRYVKTNALNFPSAWRPNSDRSAGSAGLSLAGEVMSTVKGFRRSEGLFLVIVHQAV